MNEPTIQAVDTKIDNLVRVVEKLADTVSNLNTVHVELNHLSEKITNSQNDISSINKDIKTINSEVLSNSMQADEFKQLKKMVMGFLVAFILGSATITKVSIDNDTRKDAIHQNQVNAMADIAKAIKDNISKGK